VAAATRGARDSGRELPAQVEVAVVGAGFGGLGTAISLKQRGMEDFVVLERGPDVGGTWLANTYPGCQCDVPSNLYSFSFARKADWTHSYPEQPQILEYLRDCAARFGVLGHMRFGCEMLDAAWLPDERRWHIETSRGTLRARVLVAAPGLLSEPAVPKIPGLDRFTGTRIHSNAWDHEHDLAGERVALIGTGATAVQIGPRIQPAVGRLHVFQRTAPWVIPHPDRAISTGLKRLYRALPPLQRLARQGVYALREGLFVPGMTRDPRLLKAHEAVARALLRWQVRDPTLRAKLTPPYHLGCKRVLLSNEWYPMLTEANTELVTDPIKEVREHAVVTADGTEREVDSIILGHWIHPQRSPDRPPSPRCGRPQALGSVGRRTPGIPGHDGRRLPQSVHPLWPQPESGAFVDRVHARGADPLRARGAGAHAPTRIAHGRGTRRRPARLERGSSAAPGRHGVGQRRLLELVPRQPGARLDHVARLHLPVSPPDAGARPRRLPPRADLRADRLAGPGVTASIDHAASINFHREGEGTPLVLLHGIGHHWQAWRPVIDRLSSEFDVIACDLPGFGRSAPLAAGTEPTVPAYADALARFFSEQGLARPHVAGNSMGGAIALELVRGHAVRSATALSPAGFWTPTERRFCQASLTPLARAPKPIRPLLTALARTRLGRAALFAQLCRRPTRMPADAAVAGLEAAWSAPAFTGALAAFRRYSFGAPGELRGVPLTVAWGGSDRLLLYARQAPRARAMLPWATHLTLGTGHLPFFDDPAAVAQVIRRCAGAPAVADPVGGGAHGRS